MAETNPEIFPLSIDKIHNGPSGQRCPERIIPFSHEVSSEHTRATYICHYIDPATEEHCGARFDKDGRPVSLD